MKQPTTALFAGPTLYGVPAERLPAHWQILPPARMGDMRCAAERGARKLVLIDGVFIKDQPPTPGEMFNLLQSGIEIYGAASLGALRAVELERYGMRGGGWVFEQFRDQRLFADDEVMVVYDGDTCRPLSEALVRLRWSLAQFRGLLPAGAAAKILDRIRTLYFPDRTRASIGDVLRSIAGTASARRFLAAYDRTNIKTDDALKLIRQVASASRQERDGSREHPR